VADATYIPTVAGFLYLAVVLDVFSRRIVGWAMSNHLYTELMIRALDMALLQRRPAQVIHHSDQGCQYTSIAFGRRCREAGVQPSMGTAGDAYDNAMCESFFGTLEAELLMREHFATHEQARRAIFAWIEGSYNTLRLHSSLGYRSPIEFEQLYETTHTASPRGLTTAGQRHGRDGRPAARPWTTRDSTNLSTARGSGAWRSSGCSSDVDYERGTLMVRQGKGKKDRMIPIGDRALAWVGRYRDEVRPELAIAGDDGTLFLTVTGQAFSDNRMTQMVRNHVRAAGLGNIGSCHLFRHAMATQMLENGADVRFIQAILGHADIKTTQVYTRVSIRALKDIHSATHPARLGRTAQNRIDLEDGEPTAVDLLTALDEEAASEGGDSL